MQIETPEDILEPNNRHEPVRYIHQATGNTMVKLSAGDVFVTRGDELITTVLGSCVAVCMRNLRSGKGGMNHFMLPGSLSDTNNPSRDSINDSRRYGAYAMNALFTSLLSPGDSAAELEAKVFGGAHVIELNSNIGTANIAFAINFLKERKIAIAAQDVGFDYPRKLIYDPKTGVIRLQRLRSAYRGYVAQNERRNLDHLIAVTKNSGTTR